MEAPLREPEVSEGPVHQQAGRDVKVSFRNRRKRLQSPTPPGE